MTPLASCLGGLYGVVGEWPLFDLFECVNTHALVCSGKEFDICVPL